MSPVRPGLVPRRRAGGSFPDMGEESPDRADTLDRAREAFGRRAWGEAHTLLLAARRVAPLEPADTERLARVAHLVGRDVESLEHLAEAHQEYLRRGEVEGAARSAFWLGHSFVAVDRLMITLLLGVTASPMVNVRPCSSLIPMTVK